MKQITQKLSKGEILIQDIPLPVVSKGMVLVKNHFSVISAGTESNTIKTAKKSLIGKAKERPEQVKQVIDTLKNQGPIKTYRAIVNRLDAYSALGYSSSGEVIKVGDDVKGFSVGDKIACSGAGYANHAEVVLVPENLCVKLSEDANLKNSCYNTLGAIAMQSVRQADLRLSESCIVIGLGLIGQLVCQILKASGVKVIGIDISKQKVEQVLNNNIVDFAFIRNDESATSHIQNITDDLGSDATIIAASSKSLDPINFAGEITRKKGKVVVLGDVPTGFDRNPYWYKKELELKMSCSYGPGRYDNSYEEKGIDYPAAYVRWTERRNMEAFQNLLLENKININYLTTHEFDLNDAGKAFDLVVNQKESFSGVVLRYDASKKHNQSILKVSPVKKVKNIKVSFIGAGNYAQTNLLPYLSSLDVELVGVLNKTGLTSKRVAEKFNFNFCTSKKSELLNNDTNTLFISTRHDTHAKYVIEALKSNKNIFVEKPLCITKDELQLIIEAKSNTESTLMVGFNRRFSPITDKIKEIFSNNALSMIYRVNAGEIPNESWIHDMEIGGGRIIGEVCHFIDYLSYINGSHVTDISANIVETSNRNNDILNISLKFSNGSIGMIAYYSNGAKTLSKEYIEIHSNGKSAMIDDFKKLTIFSKSKIINKKLFSQNKGQKEMVELFIKQINNTGESIIPFEDIVNVTETTFKILDSIKHSGEKFSIGD